MSLALPIPDELVRAIADRVAAILAERQHESDGYLDVSAAAAFLACPESRIYALKSAGWIPYRKDGSRLLFDRTELHAYVQNGGAKRP